MNRISRIALVVILAIGVFALYRVGFARSGPQVSVSPSTELRNGQAVTITVSGFPAGSQVAISECATAASANDLGCGLVTVSDPAALLIYPVQSTASAGPDDTSQVEACSQCVIVASAGAGQPYATAPIAFEGP
jgi:hypothetical protein